SPAASVRPSPRGISMAEIASAPTIEVFGLACHQARMASNNRMKLAGRGHRFVQGLALPAVLRHVQANVPRPCNLCGALDGRETPYAAAIDYFPLAVACGPAGRSRVLCAWLGYDGLIHCLEPRSGPRAWLRDLLDPA